MNVSTQKLQQNIVMPLLGLFLLLGISIPQTVEYINIQPSPSLKTYLSAEDDTEDTVDDLPPIRNIEDEPIEEPKPPENNSETIGGNEPIAEPTPEPTAEQPKPTAPTPSRRRLATANSATTATDPQESSEATSTPSVQSSGQVAGVSTTDQPAVEFASTPKKPNFSVVIGLALAGFILLVLLLLFRWSKVSK